MEKCRCPICGKKNAGGNSRNGKLWNEYRMGRDENGYSFTASKGQENKLLRRRMKNALPAIIDEQMEVV